MSTDVARRPGARKALSDMARSLLLMAVVVAALLLLGPARSLVFPGDKDQWQSADSSGAVRGFAELSHQQALVPRSLPNGWRVNAARVLREQHGAAHLHIGWAVSGHYAGLDETTGDGATLITSLGGRGTTTTTTVGTTVWTERHTTRGELMLSRTDGAVTVVITGDASDEQLRTLAGSLL